MLLRFWGYEGYIPVSAGGMVPASRLSALEVRRRVLLSWCLSGPDACTISIELKAVANGSNHRRKTDFGRGPGLHCPGCEALHGAVCAKRNRLAVRCRFDRAFEIERVDACKLVTSWRMRG